MASVVAHLLSPSPGWNSDNPLPSALCYVAGIAILLGANISNSDLERAHHLLCDFYNALPELYNSDCIHYSWIYHQSVIPSIFLDPLLTTMNIHMLRHLTFHVQNFGPLWAFSCFGFESLNGDIKKTIPWHKKHVRTGIYTYSSAFSGNQFA